MIIYGGDRDLIVWKTKRQSMIEHSTNDTEINAAAYAVKYSLSINIIND